MGPIPTLTAEVAHASFPDGCLAMHLRDVFYGLYRNHEFADLFAVRGQPALLPWRLALISVLQFVEDLSDRAAADAVRRCIDWKYALGLELTDPGFHSSVLSEFRSRLIDGAAEERLLNRVLAHLRAQGLVHERGQQRTDSTHVLAAIRTLNRVEVVAETLRHALESLAVAAPAWLCRQIPPDWWERYSTRVEDYALPKDPNLRQALIETIGADGRQLLRALYAPSAPSWLRELPAVEVLRQVWVQQYYATDATGSSWRAAEDLPPASMLIQSPYDVEARYATKRQTHWVGYKVHVTETCDAELPRVITQITTAVAPASDGAAVDPIHAALAQRQVLPAQHLVDQGYVDAAALVTSQHEYGVDLVGRVGRDTSWQAQAGVGLGLEHFTIDWAAQQVTCPQGQISQGWRETTNEYGTAVIRVHFRDQDCRGCPVQAQCTTSRERGRRLTLRPQEQQAALQAARARQETAEFKAQYALRAGVEGTLSQGVRAFGLRRSRYIGQAKTHLQHVLTAVALTVARVYAWWRGVPRAGTRVSQFAKLAPPGALQNQVGCA
jgi:transposase